MSFGGIVCDTDKFVVADTGNTSQTSVYKVSLE